MTIQNKVFHPKSALKSTTDIKNTAWHRQKGHSVRDQSSRRVTKWQNALSWRLVYLSWSGLEASGSHTASECNDKSSPMESDLPDWQNPISRSRSILNASTWLSHVHVFSESSCVNSFKQQWGHGIEKASTNHTTGTCDGFRSTDPYDLNCIQQQKIVLELKWQIRYNTRFLVVINDYRAFHMILYSNICIDESMSWWYRLRGYLMESRIPHYVSMDWTPENGCEFKTATYSKRIIKIRI